MTLTPINTIPSYPTELRPLLFGARLYDSSCSPEARVIFVDKDGGYFLKCASKGALQREALMTRYFHGKGLAAEVLSYVSAENDWLLTAKIHGDDCTTAKYLEQPKRLCDIYAERLALLHAADYKDCPIQKEKHAHPLKNDTLLHGDYCLPNVILNNWEFSGFIDLDNSGVGDRHVDIFWGIWSLEFNLKTDKYRERFIDAYGRGRVDEDMLRIVGAREGSA
ncbi:MAG: aminoglycoside 3'-phosphotransferase [Defluviitaleaceae bacterium]|nr:aminoglycoside 3'-phosphotransferase [Defluviitaleaceae bacterium]